MEQLQSFENRIQTLADKDLLEQTQQLFKREKRLGDAILLGLKEIKARRIYSALGYASLFEMLVKYFKLSESSSYQRLNALKLIEAVPEAQEFIFKGEVSVTNAALVQSFIQRSEKEAQAPLTVEEKKELIEVIKDKTHKQAQALLSARHPTASLPANREKPLTTKYTQLQLTVDQETMALMPLNTASLSAIPREGDTFRKRPRESFLLARETNVNMLDPRGIAAQALFNLKLITFTLGARAAEMNRVTWQSNANPTIFIEPKRRTDFYLIQKRGPVNPKRCAYNH